MDESLEVLNIKTEPTESTSSDQWQISPDMQVESVKQDSNCLIRSVIYIKTEPQEDENEFPVIAGTSNGMDSIYNMKIETEEPMVKIEYEDMVDEILQDPLDVFSDIKVKEHFQIGLDRDELGIKTEQIKGEKKEIFLETDIDNSYGIGSNQSQDQLLTRNDIDCKDDKYICSECDKKFKLKGDFNRHVRIHTGEKPYLCAICKKLFNQKSHLDAHMLIHSGEKPHVCDICKKSFREKSKLKKHKLIHSGEKQFSCDVCGKSFAHKLHLVEHKRIHTGHKPYICDLCSKAFTQKIHLIQHKRVHTGEKPFSCETCNKSFVRKEHLTKHLKIHNK